MVLFTNIAWTIVADDYQDMLHGIQTIINFCTVDGVGLIQRLCQRFVYEMLILSIQRSLTEQLRFPIGSHGYQANEQT